MYINIYIYVTLESEDLFATNTKPLNVVQSFFSETGALKNH